MKILFLDNFRGLKNTFIPLKNINFLVGENSTGKTSVLSLINLLSDFNFWSSQGTFNNQEVRLGHFKDIVSIRSNDKSYFKVGLCDTTKSLKAILLKYMDDKGNPRLSEIHFLHDRLRGYIRIEKGGKPMYRVMPNRFLNIESDSLNIFRKWVGRTNIVSKSKLKSFDDNYYIALVHLINDVVTMKIPRKQGVAGNVFRRTLPSLFRNLVWFAPIRAKAQRTYDDYSFEFSSEGKHIPYLIKDILSDKDTSKRKMHFIQNTQKFGKYSGLFDEIKILPFGEEDTSPFELDVLLNKIPYKISNVGYGVSQVLPIVTEIITRRKGACFLIQQPEVHLHPKAQAALGDIIFEAYRKEQKEFIIETHSDYSIDRFRIDMNRAKKGEKPSSQVLFFEKNKYGNKISFIEINDNGSYSSNQPKSFRSFFLKEQLKIIQL